MIADDNRMTRIREVAGTVGAIAAAAFMVIMSAVAVILFLGSADLVYKLGLM